jgi:hypothetical protein
MRSYHSSPLIGHHASGWKEQYFEVLCTNPCDITHVSSKLAILKRKQQNNLLGTFEFLSLRNRKRLISLLFFLNVTGPDFRRSLLMPTINLKALLTNGFMLVSCLAYASALKMKNTCSTETSVYLQHTKRRSRWQNSSHPLKGPKLRLQYEE